MKLLLLPPAPQPPPPPPLPLQHQQQQQQQRQQQQQQQRVHFKTWLPPVALGRVINWLNFINAAASYLLCPFSIFISCNAKPVQSKSEKPQLGWPLPSRLLFFYPLKDTQKIRNTFHLNYMLWIVYNQRSDKFGHLAQ